MKRPNLRVLNPGARARSAVLGSPVRTLGAAPAAKVKVTAAFYGTAAWKNLLRKIIKARGRRCQDVNCRTPHRGEGQRIYGDHVVELQDGGAPLDERNVLLRCAPCHGRKSAAAREARAGGEAIAPRPPGGEVAKSAGDRFHRIWGPSLEGVPNSATFFRPRHRP